jgi:hypothetical protein
VLPSRQPGLASAVFLGLSVASACSSSLPDRPDTPGPTSSAEGGAAGGADSADSGGSAVDASLDAAAPLDASLDTPAPLDAPVATGDDGAADSPAGDGVAPVPDGGSPPDAAAGPDTSIESISVGAGAPVSFKTSLAQGATYLLKAAGSVDLGTLLVDAEFFYSPGNTGWRDGEDPYDYGIDVGLLQPNPELHTTLQPDGPGRIKWYIGGPAYGFRSDHTYYMVVTGAGKPLTLTLMIPPGRTAVSGAIAVSLFALGGPPPATYTPMNGPNPAPPAAPKIGRDAIETLQVPVMNSMATTRLTTDRSAIYLLEASGAGQVSKGAPTPASPHLGDAEYMDWPLSGAKFNDGECNADFGIGVDEPAPPPCMHAPAYSHRKTWWGPYRNDHVYYMLYAGTGAPLSFLYFDSGYGDNSPTDTLTMRVFPVP